MNEEHNKENFKINLKTNKIKDFLDFELILAENRKKNDFNKTYLENNFKYDILSKYILENRDNDFIERYFLNNKHQFFSVENLNHSLYFYCIITLNINLLHFFIKQKNL